MLILILTVVFIGGCGGGSNESPTETGGSSTTKSISGYVIDDPVPNAMIKLFDSKGVELGAVSSDSNGYFSIAGVRLKEGDTYCLQAEGNLANQTINMHSCFSLTENVTDDNITVNINPLTEIAYRLYKEKGNLPEAEAKVREYFQIPTGRWLGEVKYSDLQGIAEGLRTLAELKGKNLPIEVIDLLVSDIANDTGSYRSLFEDTFQIIPSSSEAEINTPITLSIVGGTKYIANGFEIRWYGVNENVIVNQTSVDVTSDIPGDKTVTVEVVKNPNSENEEVIATKSVTINFYEVKEPVTVNIENATQDTEVNVADDTTVKIPAGAVPEGTTITFREVVKNSLDTYKEFILEPSGMAFSEPVEIRIKYDPALVPDPRTLQVVRRSDDGSVDVLKIKEIDYENHEIVFETEHFSVYELKYVTVKNPEDRLLYLYNALNYKLASNSILPSPFNQWATVSLKDFLEELYPDYDSLIEDLYFDSKVYYFYFFASNTQDPYEEFTNILTIELPTKLPKAALDYFANSWQILVRAFNLYLFAEKTIALAREIESEYGSFQRYYNELNNLLSNPLWEINYGGAASYVSSQIVSKLGSEKVLLIVDILSYLRNIHPVQPSENVSFYNFLIDLGTNLLQGIHDVGDFISFGASINADIAKLSEDEDYKRVSQSVNDIVESSFNIASLLNGNPGPVLISVGLNMAKEYISKQTMLEQFKDEWYLWFDLIAKEDELLKFGYYKNGELKVTEDIWEALKNSPNLEIIGIPINFETIWNTVSYDGSYLYRLLKPDNLNLSLPFYSDKPFYSKNRLKRLAFIYIVLKAIGGDSKCLTFLEKIRDLSKNIIEGILLTGKYLKEKDIQYFIYDDPEKGVCTTFPPTKESVPIQIIKRSEIKRSEIRSSTISEESSEIQAFPVFKGLSELLQMSNIQVKDSIFKDLVIHKIQLKVNLYPLVNDNGVLSINENDKQTYNFFSTEEIISNAFSLQNSTYILPLNSIFEVPDYLNNFISLTVVVNFSYKEKEFIYQKNLQFISLSDEIEEPYRASTLLSSVKDAITLTPIEGAMIILYPTSIINFTDESGNYEFTNLAPGTYTIEVYKEGYSPVTGQVTLEDGETKVFEALLTLNTEHAEGNGTLTGTIKDALNGNGIANATIEFREGQNILEGEPIATTTTDSNGQFSIELPAGTYTGLAKANGYIQASFTFVVIANETTTKDISLSPVLPENEVRIVLTWGETPPDLDSHLVKIKDGQIQYHVYYSNMHPTDEADLDHDDTTSFGPETITIHNLDTNATYKYYVHDYSNGGNHQDEQLANSQATVKVYWGDRTYTYYVPNGIGNAWKVFEIVNGTLIPCTENCLFGVDGPTDSLIGTRTIVPKNTDIELLKNLPAK